ncbi:MAG: 4-oxalocrotonate tautomerase family protein, partial [Candidatus Bathyarchaeota archaeon]|nr:4-oxalocrotonate tautomerase family protein [Candidatus Bathyarchaeota archaeon]
IIKFFRINTVLGDVLPIVVVEMWEGRTEEQKAKLIKGITEVFKQIGVEPEHLSIVIHDVPKSNWGMRGEQASKLIRKGAE